MGSKLIFGISKCSSFFPRHPLDSNMCNYKTINYLSMTITSSLRLLYIFGGSGLLCATCWWQAANLCVAKSNGAWSTSISRIRPQKYCTPSFMYSWFMELFILLNSHPKCWVLVYLLILNQKSLFLRKKLAFFSFLR